MADQSTSVSLIKKCLNLVWAKNVKCCDPEADLPNSKRELQDSLTRLNHM